MRYQRNKTHLKIEEIILHSVKLWIIVFGLLYIKHENWMQEFTEITIVLVTH